MVGTRVSVCGQASAAIEVSQIPSDMLLYTTLAVDRGMVQVGKAVAGVGVLQQSAWAMAPR